jgi:hypothetical protein
VDDTVVTNIIEKIEAKFGKMTVTRGKHHVVLGMDITFDDNDGTVTILMKEYLKEAITDSGMDVSKVASTPANKDLFTVDDVSEQLDKRQGEIFHSIVAKLLYVSKRARTDAQLAIAFLCTRVSCSTEQDWEKLIRLLRYFNGTLDMPLILGADSLTESKSWVDAAYAVHDDMKSHTGGATSLGRGAIMCKSTKQKLNTKSSTEAEVVGSSDYLPNTVWARMFLAEQGYKLTENIFYQDNQSAIRLEKNGRASCGQKSSHIDIRYFFMQDRFESEGISVVYCPTDEMLADFFTKPLQGSLFRKFRAVLLGHCHVKTLTRSPLPPSEERVENPILEKVRSGGSGQTFALPTKKKVSEQMEVASALTYASVLKKGLKLAPVAVHSF